MHYRKSRSTRHFCNCERRFQSILNHSKYITILLTHSDIPPPPFLLVDLCSTILSIAKYSRFDYFSEQNGYKIFYNGPTNQRWTKWKYSCLYVIAFPPYIKIYQKLQISRAYWNHNQACWRKVSQNKGLCFHGYICLYWFRIKSALEKVGWGRDKQPQKSKQTWLLWIV